jgi:hypothetical protein
MRIRLNKSNCVPEIENSLRDAKIIFFAAHAKTEIDLQTDVLESGHDPETWMLLLKICSSFPTGCTDVVTHPPRTCLLRTHGLHMKAAPQTHLEN